MTGQPGNYYFIFNPSFSPPLPPSLPPINPGGTLPTPRLWRWLLTLIVGAFILGIFVFPLIDLVHDEVWCWMAEFAAQQTTGTFSGCP